MLKWCKKVYKFIKMSKPWSHIIDLLDNQVGHLKIIKVKIIYLQIRRYTSGKKALAKAKQTLSEKDCNKAGLVGQKPN